MTADKISQRNFLLYVAENQSQQNKLVKEWVIVEKGL